MFIQPVTQTPFTRASVGGVIDRSNYSMTVDGRIVTLADQSRPGTVMLLGASDMYPFWTDYSGTISDNLLTTFPGDIEAMPDDVRRSIFFPEDESLNGINPPEWQVITGTWRALFYLYGPDHNVFFDWITGGESEATNRIYYFGNRTNLYEAVFVCEDGAGSPNRDVGWWMPKLKMNRDYCLSASRDINGITSAYLNGMKLARKATGVNSPDTTGDGDIDMSTVGGSAGSFSSEMNSSVGRTLEMRNVHETREDHASNLLNPSFSASELELLEWDDFTTDTTTVALFEPDDVGTWIDHGPNNTTFDVSLASPASTLFGERLWSFDENSSADLTTNPHLHITSDITIETVFYATDTIWGSPRVSGSGESLGTNYLWSVSNTNIFYEKGSGTNIDANWPNPISIEIGRMYRSLYTVQDHGDGTCTSRLIMYDDDGGVQDSGELTTDIYEGGGDGSFLLRANTGFMRYCHIKNAYTSI